MSVSWTKLKVPARTVRRDDRARPKGELSADDIVAYIADPQAGGDYYSEAGQALLMWHTTSRSAVELGIARSGERPRSRRSGDRRWSLAVRPAPGERQALPPRRRGRD